MKTTRNHSSLAGLRILTFSAMTLLASNIFLVPRGASAAVIAGPITNSANGHLYFLLSQSDWTTAELAAWTLGGHLVTINDAAEDSWVRATFGSYGGEGRYLWIGLYDDGAGWQWSNGEAVTYVNWDAGQPSHGYANGEPYALMMNNSDRWDDWQNCSTWADGGPMLGVAEVVPNGAPVSANTLYVSVGSTNPTPPYTTWATAATNIQQAVQAAGLGAEIAVTNGVYAGGVAVNKPLLRLRSINGPQFTVINGGGTNQCAYLTDGASLSGFALTNGSTGVSCPTSGVVSNCLIACNSGDGASGGTLYNCALTENSGLGANGCTLYNCTVTGNLGGGVSGGTLNNCIVYFNTAGNGANFDTSSSLNYCCTTPQPTNGTGNISTDPQLASASHLSAFSPCRGAGSTNYAMGTDIDGEAWGTPPSMGCDEYHAGAVTGPLSVGILPAATNVALGYPMSLAARIQGRTSLSLWDFGDGTLSFNEPYVTHAWKGPGDYVISLWALNDSQPEGESAVVTIHILGSPVQYVAIGNLTPTAPYLSWATAATNIQDAVDHGYLGGTVLVSDGVYAMGERTMGPSRLANRVAVDKPVMVRSVNGPQFTVIQGHQVAGTTNGDGAIRCAYLADGASLSGFTLTNGATRADGAPDREASGGGLWCESTNVLISNCVITGNSAYGGGGGAYGGSLSNCTLVANLANGGGGGACSGTLNNCTLTGNSAEWGGGASGSRLFNCTLTGNSASFGGGASDSVLNQCRLLGNSASGSGGGASWSSLNNCVLTGNSAGAGGGAANGTLNNCTLVGNSASYGGGAIGGMFTTTLNNCIVYFNSAAQGSNYTGCILNYCCTTPLPANGNGNICLDPQLLDSAHLSPSSPCRGAGSTAYATGTDIDGEPWASPPSIGCDEYYPGVAMGPLRVTVAAARTKVVVDYPVELTAVIEGRASLSVWDFGDGQALTNRPCTEHAWAAVGDFPVVLWAYNQDNSGGVSATTTVHVVTQPVYYVAKGSVTPAPPFTSWATAATNIQDAIDAADVASPPPTSVLVLVTNGVYATGGRAVVGTMTNRVAVDKPLTVRSVNGPQFTVIQGYQVPGTTNGDGAIRCAYVTNGATLSGFTLTKGATRGVWGSGVDDSELSGGGLWGESSAVISNCVFVGNSADSGGGGACGGTLDHCTLTTNTAASGGGASWSSLNNCTLTGNSANGGGGSCNSTLNNCTLTGNSASEGGGVSGGTLNNCALVRNSATRFGGGVLGGTLNNCVLTGNSAAYGGGGAYEGTLNNCTLTGNSAGESGGGGQICTLNNCIIYFNTAPVEANYFQEQPDSAVTVNYCCIMPIPLNGVGNISLDPRLASASHLSAGSPCRGAGSTLYASGTDIDGEAWARPPSIGCDEYHAGAVTGPLSVSLIASFTNVAAGFSVELTALIEGRTTASTWDFGDGMVVSNQPCPSHVWASPGDYAVILRANNETLPAGISATQIIHVVEATHYVATGSTNPVPPYTSWGTAARKIQDAVDAASVNGALVLVTNGTYATGGRAVGTNVLVNRVAVTKLLRLRSVNGPQFTVIQGYQVPGSTNGDGAVRCVWLTSGASLSGFTLTRGATRDWYSYWLDTHGGGVFCDSASAVVSNCVITGNSAYGGGGGTYAGTLNNCVLTGNSGSVGAGASGSGTPCILNNCVLTGNCAGSTGGGASDATLNNCTVTGNSAHYGGGTCWGTVNNCTLTGNSANGGGGSWNSTLNNCILYFNAAADSANYNQDSRVLNYCCTAPMPTNGVGNITNAPLFVDQANGNLRLQTNSPCINAGLNAYAPGPTDLDGLPRIVSGTVDIGAYEFQGPGSLISYAWLQQYGLPTDGSADYADADHDGMNNWQEWRCGTDATNADSALRLLSPQPTGTNVTVTWQSVVGVNYFLECSTNLSATPCFTCVATNVPGQSGTTTYTDTNAVGTGPFFYRVGVGN